MSPGCPSSRVSLRVWFGCSEQSLRGSRLRYNLWVLGPRGAARPPEAAAPLVGQERIPRSRNEYEVPHLLETCSKVLSGSRGWMSQHVRPQAFVGQIGPKVKMISVEGHVLSGHFVPFLV